MHLTSLGSASHLARLLAITLLDPTDAFRRAPI